MHNLKRKMSATLQFNIERSDDDSTDFPIKVQTGDLLDIAKTDQVRIDNRQGCISIVLSSSIHP